MQPNHTLDEQLEREITLTDLMRILYRGRWVIATCFFVVMALTTYYTFTVTPEYEAVAKVMVRTDGSGMGLSLFDVGGIIKQETVINNQVEILKSRTPWPKPSFAGYRIPNMPIGSKFWARAIWRARKKACWRASPASSRACSASRAMAAMSTPSMIWCRSCWKSG
ncbi:MAG: Wzz/FepE/Etk N-terminal domain-containing protein [candidate division KSB1 bacterium]|nr:Wzz/FepE/Etk N-terminal domain-containing protein [candidate division KSB1 bacterium]